MSALIYASGAYDNYKISFDDHGIVRWNNLIYKKFPFTTFVEHLNGSVLTLADSDAFDNAYYTTEDEHTDGSMYNLWRLRDWINKMVPESKRKIFGTTNMRMQMEAALTPHQKYALWFTLPCVECAHCNRMDPAPLYKVMGYTNETIENFMGTSFHPIVSTTILVHNCPSCSPATHRIVVNSTPWIKYSSNCSDLCHCQGCGG
jgi:hypothetical protein